MAPSLTLLALNCTLKAEGDSSTDRLLKLVIDAFGKDVKAEVVRTNYNDADSSDEFVDAKIDARRTQAVVGLGLRF